MLNPKIGFFGVLRLDTGPKPGPEPEPGPEPRAEPRSEPGPGL